MSVRIVCLSNQSSRLISFEELSQVARALQRQQEREFASAWGVRARVVALGAGEKEPADVWPMRIVDRPKGGLGIHLDARHKPYAQVMATPDWSITASHELLEMVVDPYGQKFMSGPGIAPASHGRRVNYLVEVCDPCEVYSYLIDGVRVSDFITPEYYHNHAAKQTRFDFLGKLTKAYACPRGCYISWVDPADGRWHQKQPDGTFVRSKTKADPKKNPRDDRDGKIPDAGGDLHDLSRILAAAERTQSSSPKA